MSNPGVLGVRRYGAPGALVADLIHDVERPLADEPVIVDPMDHTRRKAISAGTPHEDLLVPVFRGGQCVHEAPPLAEFRARAAAGLAGCHAGVRRFVHPHQYPVGLELGLHELKTRLILEARGFEISGSPGTVRPERAGGANESKGA